MSIPNGVLQDKKPYVLQGQNILLLSDMHIPYHCKKSIDKALALGKKEKVDTILLNGDTVDFFTISRFNKTPDNPNIQKEINTTVEILQYIRKMFPKAIIYFKIGNHELRLNKYLNDHPELYSLDCLKMDKLFKFDELKIRLIESNTIMQVSDFFISHGHETQAGGLTPARNMLMKQHCNFIFGHLHRSDEFQFRKPDASLIKTYSVGCLCNLYPEYWENNNWNNGCLIIKRTKNGKTEVNNYRF